MIFPFFRPKIKLRSLDYDRDTLPVVLVHPFFEQNWQIMGSFEKTDYYEGLDKLINDYSGHLIVLEEEDFMRRTEERISKRGFLYDIIATHHKASLPKDGWGALRDELVGEKEVAIAGGYLWGPRFEDWESYLRRPNQLCGCVGGAVRELYKKHKLTILSDLILS